MFFCRHKEAVKRAFAVSTSYMPAKADETETYDPYATTIQWSRRATGLKVFMALAELGLSGYAKLIDHQAAMGDLLRHRLQQTGWAVVNTTALPVVCFTHAGLSGGRHTTQEILHVVYRRNRVWISEVVLGGTQKVLRARITSYNTEPTDIEVLIDGLETARMELSDVRYSIKSKQITVHNVPKEDNLMKMGFALIFGLIFGTIGGIVLLTLLTLLLLALIVPDMLDWEWFLMFIYVSVPAGAVLGAATGLSIVLLDYKKATIAGWVRVVTGAFVALRLILLFLEFWYNSRLDGEDLIYWEIVIGTPLVLSLGMIYQGHGLLPKSK